MIYMMVGNNLIGLRVLEVPLQMLNMAWLTIIENNNKWCISLKQHDLMSDQDHVEGTVEIQT